MIETTVIDVQQLFPRARQGLADELYEACHRILGTMSRDSFGRLLLGTGAERVRVQVVRDGDTVVGFATVQIDCREVEGRPCRTMRSSVELLPEYRPHRPCAGFIAYEALRLRATSGVSRLLHGAMKLATGTFASA